MAARRKRLRGQQTLATVATQNPYDTLTDGIARLFAPVIQEGLRRGVGLALANTGQVANGALLVQQPSLGSFNSSFQPGEVEQIVAQRRQQSAGDGSKCKEPGCTNPVRCKDLCSKHYQVARRRAVKRTGATARKPQRSPRAKRQFSKPAGAPVRGPRSARKAKKTTRKAPRAARPAKTAAKLVASEPKVAA
jgi:hypothetical protein